MCKNATMNLLKRRMQTEEIGCKELSERTGIPRTTLYSMSKKSTNQVDLGHLKRLADFFGENISIFCGLEDYEPPLRLSDEERLVLTIYRSLNAAGKKRLSDYAEELGGNPNMRRK